MKTDISLGGKKSPQQHIFLENPYRLIGCGVWLEYNKMRAVSNKLGKDPSLTCCTSLKILLFFIYIYICIIFRLCDNYREAAVRNNCVASGLTRWEQLFMPRPHCLSEYFADSSRFLVLKATPWSVSQCLLCEALGLISGYFELIRS